MSKRQRGTLVFPMPEGISGQGYKHAVLRNADGAVRMVNTEGVAYDVTDKEPWVWNDFIEGLPTYSPEELIAKSKTVEPVDLADFVRTFGQRLETNFFIHHRWANDKPSNMTTSGSSNESL